MSKYAFREDEGDKRPIGEWRQIAEKEGHTLLNGKPNPFRAARAYSEKGKPTTVVRLDNRRVVYDKGYVVHRDKLENKND